jgi:primase-polymerase (primpol)-like protein
MFDVMKQILEPKVPVIRTFDDLKAHKHWVCYDRLGRLISPITRQNADGKHPLCWGTYERARKHWSNERSYIVGIGFMLTDEFGITVLDVYNCLHDGTLSEFACELVETLDAYTEISIGGTGLRIWVQNLLHEPPVYADEEERKQAIRENPATFFKVTGKEWGVR